MSQPLKSSQKQYIEWLRRSSTRQRQLPKEKLEHAWESARQAAQLLRERYNVNRVRVFGSLLYLNRFHDKSDIDLAVEGLSVHNYWDALADVLFLDNSITVDIVEPDTCPPTLWAIIEQEGVDI